MKLAKYFAVTSSLLLIAGCSHKEQHQARYSEFPAYGGSSTTSASSSSTYQTGTGTSSSAQQPTSSSTASSTSPTQGGQTQGDRALVAQVQQNLSQDTTLATIAPALQISAQNGTVTLSGNVSSEQEKQRIETAVKGTGGVASVNNQLQVSLTPTGQGSRLYQDSTTTTPASPSSTPDSSKTSPDSSKTSPDLSKSDSSAATSDAARAESAATASASASKSDTALSPTSQAGSTNRIYSSSQAATTTAGDSSNLSIQASTEADRSLGQKIQQEIRNESSLAGQLSSVKVMVDNGKIMLSGAVKSDDQKQAVEKAVQRVTGVTSVDNQIQVSANPTADSTTPARTPEK
jgi:trimeric autotransporter adhesin